jgi:hypothetical protein
MIPLIIISIVAALFAIGAYQYIIHKYYWGPKGRPEDRRRKKDDGQR